METEKFAKQMVDFQKATFDNTFTAVTMLQDQARTDGQRHGRAGNLAARGEPTGYRRDGWRV